MNGRTFLYVFLVLVVGAGAALMGALGGGYIVYRAMQPQASTNSGSMEQLLNAAAPTPAQEPGASPAQDAVNAATEKLVVSTTEIETAITQAVEKIGPAVVTVTTHLPGGGRRSFFSPSQGSPPVVAG